MKPDEQWKKLEEQQDKDLSALINMNTISRLPSIDPLEKIKRNLIFNSIWGVLIVALYTYILINFPFWQLFASIGLVMLFTMAGVYSALALYLRMNQKLPSDSVLNEMERHYQNIQQWMRIQQNIGLFLYPVSAAGGFMLGGFVGSGKPIEVFMGKPMVIIILLLVIAILVPLCYLLAKWMNRKSFGQYADQLKKNIDELKSDQ
jgi:hypothetical protein